ncbi:MAG: DUF3631 domain-containing protein [Hyphomicrobiaceae bacterium]
MTDKEIESLCQLSPLEYGRQRRDAAARFGITVGCLDEAVKDARKNRSLAEQPRQGNILCGVEPWPDPVIGMELLADIARIISRFMVLPAGAASTIALWVMFAHAHDAADHSPILAIESPEKRCGKTTLLQILHQLVPKPLPAANITAPSLFRSIEKYYPTLLLDEAETYTRNDENMRGVLNSGFTRDSAFVIRTEGEDFEPRPFSTWSPKVLALIGELPDTLQDRSIVVTLRRRLEHESVERFSRKAYSALHEQRAKAARWALDDVQALQGADPDMPPGLDDRARDCWRPLLAVADMAGGDWPERARKAALQLSSARDGDANASTGVRLLSHIREVFDARGTDAIASSELVRLLIENESWPWAELRQGRPITPHWLARTLKRYDIAPHKGRMANQYRRDDFRDAWVRYLPSPPPSNESSTPPPPERNSRPIMELNPDREGCASSTRRQNVELLDSCQAIEISPTSSPCGDMELCDEVLNGDKASDDVEGFI